MAETKTTTEDTTNTQGQGGVATGENSTTSNAEGNTTTGSEGKPQKTEDEIRKELTEELTAKLKKDFEKDADRRVTEALKKRDKDWEDKNRKAKMTEEEKRAEEERERLEKQAKMDHEYKVKGLRIAVVDAVEEMGLPTSFRNLIAVDDLAMIEDEADRSEKLTARVKGMKALFDEEVAKAVELAKAEFLKGQTPATGADKGGKENSNRYEQYRKDGNVKGMLAEKLNAARANNENTTK